MEQIKRAIEPHPGHKTNIHDVGAGDLDAFVRWLQREAWLLGDAFVWFQAELIADAALTDREDFIVALLELDPPILRRQPPPPSQVFTVAFTYARTNIIPLLTRIWPLPDDLPHAAGMGNFSRVKQWFDESGAPALGDLYHHYPCYDAHARGHLDWDPPTAQHVLDVALAWSVVNRHFEVADFLLEHGADINTNWSSHESASILHELVFHANYESMQFLIDRGIDMTIRDDVERDSSGLGAPRRERREDGAVAGGGGTAAGTGMMSMPNRRISPGFNSRATSTHAPRADPRYS
jgi:hypothetical protein